MKESDKNDEVNSIVSVLKDVEAISIDIFKTLLSSIAGMKLQSKRSSWSMISKFIHQNAEEKAAPNSGFDAVDTTLDSLICQKKKSGFIMSQVESMKSEMMKLESEIQDLDEGLECLSRNLVRTRATLLNMLSY